MSVTRLAVLGVAIGSAVMAAYLAKGFLEQPATTEVVEVNRVETTDVLVVAQDVKMGDRVAQSVQWQSWPSDSVSPHMITRKARPQALKEFETARARSDMFEGEPLSNRKLIIPQDAGFMAAILPKGMRAISVRISAETGAGGFILPNDKVDVIRVSKRDGGRTVSELVLSNVRVLAIDQRFKTDESGQQVAVGKTATVELEPKQVEVLAMAESSGQLTLALRSIADRGNSELGDDGPMLAESFTHGGRANQVAVYRYGIQSVTELTK